MNRATELKERAGSDVLRQVIGVFAPCDPRVDEASRQRAASIVRMTADTIAGRWKSAGDPPAVVYTRTLVDGEKQADEVARQFRDAGVTVLVAVPDTWAFPQLTLISLIQQFPQDTPLNLTCGNSGPKPGVVYTHACSGALAQYGRLVHINVGTWPDTGRNPVMSDATAASLMDWCYAAVTRQALRGRRVVVFGHDSMGMETALAHVTATRAAFGLEITRLDMKLLADMLHKRAYPESELRQMRQWFNRHAGGRIEQSCPEDAQRFDQGLALYLIIRGILKDLNAVGGGFMSQLEWGSDTRGVPLPVLDVAESLFNSSFDHGGRKEPVPFATEADVQGLLTMLFLSRLTGGNPPLFMDFRKVWEPWEVKNLAEKLKVRIPAGARWALRGFVDGDNSGSASFDWAGRPGASVKEIMSGVSFPLADRYYFPGLGNSVTFVSPGGIRGIAGRIAYSTLSGMFSLVWDQAETVELPAKLAEAVCRTSTSTWPHTFVTPRFATMGEYKHYAPANHFHMVWDLEPARLEYWMDLSNVLSVTPWRERPAFLEGVDRPVPLLYLLNGGEAAAKQARRT